MHLGMVSSVIIGSARSEHSADSNAVLLVRPSAQRSQSSVGGTAPFGLMLVTHLLYDVSFTPLFRAEKTPRNTIESLEEAAGSKGGLPPLGCRELPF